MRLLVAANRGPLRSTDDGSWTPAVGGLTTALLPVLEDHGGVWVASQSDPPLPERFAYPQDDPRFVVRSLDHGPEEYDLFYGGMANAVLWPVSHYMMQHLDMQPGYAKAYRDVNGRFARAIVEEHQEGDHIWVQDYHLMLTPGLVRQERPDAHIGFFWHIPWPAMEVFRILPWSRELLRGMLGADLIGVHVDEYVDNFLEACRVLLGAEVGRNDHHGIVHWEGREVRVGAHPIGIDVDYFERMTASPETQREIEHLRSLAGDSKVVVGIDRLDYTKGILSRLLAFESFLEENPDWHGQVTFYQVATPSRTEVESYKQLKREVDEAVGRINGAYARDDWTPVHYRYRTYTQQELCAFYHVADVMLITPLRDGMNLVTQEFVAASDSGVLLLSELTGAAYLLPEALQVNPYDAPGLVRALCDALEMDPSEQQQRLHGLKATVRDLDIHRWAEGFYQAMLETA